MVTLLQAGSGNLLSCLPSCPLARTVARPALHGPAQWSLTGGSPIVSKSNRAHDNISRIFFIKMSILQSRALTIENLVFDSLSLNRTYMGESRLGLNANSVFVVVFGPVITFVHRFRLLVPSIRSCQPLSKSDCKWFLKVTKFLPLPAEISGGPSEFTSDQTLLPEVPQLTKIFTKFKLIMTISAVHTQGD